MKNTLLALVSVCMLSACCTPKTPVSPGPLSAGPLSPGSAVAHEFRPPNKITDPGTIEALKSGGIEASQISCNGSVVWLPELGSLAKRAAAEIATHDKLSLSSEQRHRRFRIVLGYMVRMVFQYLGTQNLGAIRLAGLHYRDAAGEKRPLMLFRSGVTTDAQKASSCLRSLLGPGRVKHVINLYGGKFPLHEFIRAEKALARELGASHYDVKASSNRWRKLIETPEDYEKNRTLAMRQVANLINTQILLPNDKPPQGNIYFHCGGGMHRSGMVFGIIRRCVNKSSMKEVETEYKRHTAYRSPEARGGYEPLNVRFIREFDCALLTPTLSKLQGS